MFIAFVAGFVTLLGIFTYLCIPKGWHKGISTLVFVLLASGTFALAFESAGQPKPMAMEWRNMSSLPVVGFIKNEEAKVIYFWVMRDGVPVTYAYPWNGDESVQQIEDQWRARGQFTGMTLTDDEEALVRPDDRNLPPKE